MSAADYPFFDAPFLAFAHRGGATYGPNQNRENSRYAFANAVELGYRYLETDVHATRDGVLLAVHDPVLDHHTEHPGIIAELTHADVRSARLPGVDPIPTLDELLEAFPTARFNIDAKADTTVDLLAATIARHDAYDRVCVAAFGIRRLHRLRRLLGRPVASAASPVGVLVNRLTPWLTWALNTSAPAIQIPMSVVVRGRTTPVLTPSLLRAAHRAGKQVHIWTVDDSETMVRLVDSGVDGIFTDRIDTLKSVLTERGLWG